MITDEIKIKIACQKLLGYTTTKHVHGYYVATSVDSNRTNVYNNKFEPILIGVYLRAISKYFILVKDGEEVKAYTSTGRLIVKASSNERLQVTNNLLYWFKNNKLAHIITTSGEIRDDVPNVHEPKCNISKTGAIYTLDTKGNLYRGKKIIDTDIRYVDEHFSECYYAKHEHMKTTVYDLDTQEVITANVFCDLQIAKDKILIETQGLVKNFYLYDTELKELVFNATDLGYSEFIIDTNGNPRLIILRQGAEYILADMQGNILTKKEYYDIDLVMRGNYIRARSESQCELLDIKGNSVLTADIIETTDYGIMLVTDSGTMVLDCETLEQY